MVISKKDVIFYRSGITGDNLGGPMHTQSVSPVSLHNVFNLVSGIERASGKTKYRCIYMKNRSLTETVINPALFIPKDTVSSTTTLYAGFDIDAGVGDGNSSGVAQSIVNETIAPTNVQFTNATDPSKGLRFGADIPPGKTIAIWVKLIIFLNTAAAPVDGASIVLRFGNVIQATTPVGTTVDTILAVTGETDSLSPFTNTVARIKLRSSINSVVFTGDTTKSTDAQTWLNMLGALKDKTIIAFGPEDSKTTTLKNALISALSTTANTKSDGYSFQRINNLYIIVMDTTLPFVNPSAQYDFVKAQLQSAKTTAGVDFIMVVCNKAFYMTLATNDITLAIDNTLRTTYHQLFIDNGVHVVISGQTRNYQRQHVLSYNSSAPDSPGLKYTLDAPSYSIPTGQKNFGPTGGCLFIDIGTGGMKPAHTPTTSKSYTKFITAMTNTTSIGYMMIKSTPRTATRGPTLLGIFYEFYTPDSTSTSTPATPVEVQRDNWAITIQ
jgi:hypothetical protein